MDLTISKEIRSHFDDFKNHRFRFPPEPNGCLHIGHVKSICLNFELAKKYDCECNLRFDDTNPETETQEYADQILKDLTWLGYTPSNICYASDYFDEMISFAKKLISDGDAFVCFLSDKDISEYRGNYIIPGKESPWRNKTLEENLSEFDKMITGEYKKGEACLRAKINFNSEYMCLRDPVIFRINFTPHFRTGSKYKVYPMYDFAHPISDCIEGISVSLCTLEFQNNRQLYNWVVQKFSPSVAPEQVEFSRLNVTGLNTSKRKILELINKGEVSGWDDIRLPTVAGLRNSGFLPEVLKIFATKNGYSLNNFDISIEELHAVARDYFKDSQKVFGIKDPLKIKINNHSEFEGLVPEYIYIESEDFSDTDSKNFFRLTKKQPVRLMNSEIIKFEQECIDEDGKMYLSCRALKDKVKTKAAIQWLDLNNHTITSAKEVVGDQIILYEFYLESKHLNEDSVCQLVRKGYYYFSNNSLTKIVGFRK